MNSDLQAATEAFISKTVGIDFHALEVQSASGGCIHQSYLLRGKDAACFVKVNAANKLDVFATEANGLEAIYRTGCIACPRPLACETFGEFSFLIMECLALGKALANGWARMGQQLAALHCETHDRFGWQRDNYIGASPQQNTWHDDWAEFFCEQRLRPQLEMARANRIKLEGEAELYEAAKQLLVNHCPRASLLHGDLWSGNAGFLGDGSPVIYDPANYYGDRETDLAFSEFFGGFPPEFYQAYQKAWPLTPGFEARKPLYKLYHVLNHANLFGGGYASQAQSTICSLVR